jgi:hypothetical protein
VPAGLKAYQSPYYRVYSDLEEERVNEALLRMTRMAEEYHERTREFSGVIREKFPFYLFKEANDYFQAGGMPGSAGVFMVDGDGARLMAIAGKETGGFTWHVVQHEGFHQFAHAVIGGELPTWANEGLAEYFGEGLFTGDGFVTGVVPPRRLQRVQEAIKNKRFKSIQSMMLLSHRQWNQEMNSANYDMAWSMVHFLAHGEEGRYTTAFSSFVKDIGRRRPWDKAWEANFGSAEGFEKKWSEWWLAQRPDVSRDLYVKATVATLTSFLGRAAGSKQTFDNIEEFARAAKEGSVKTPQEDWLPPGLLAASVGLMERMQAPAPRKEAGEPEKSENGAPKPAAVGGIKFELASNPAKQPSIVVTMKDQTRVVGIYNPRAKAGPARVTVTIDDTAVKIGEAKELLAERKRDRVRAVLQDALKRNPQSPLAGEARKLLQQALQP